MKLKDELLALAKDASGGKDTHRGRAGAMRQFADFLAAKNIQIKSVEHVKAKHVSDFILMKLETIDKRSAVNLAGHLRIVLEKAGRGKLASLPQLSNKALGIAGASRKGTKTAMSGERFRYFAARIDDKGVLACTRLADGLGLRAKEAIMSDLKTLKQWEKNIERGEKCYVIHGTKGGRERWVGSVDKARALASVRGAIKIAQQNGGKLIPGTLQQAKNRYKNQMTKAGFIGKEAGHSLRYSFAHRQYDFYKSAASGLSERDALVQLSRDLGHGDGRGRYCVSTYLR